LNPANPGMSFHKLDRAKDKNFWSVRVNDDIRIIVHKTESLDEESQSTALIPACVR
jgi:plasmid maintenance system killer protein